jgi:membrane protein
MNKTTNIFTLLVNAWNKWNEDQAQRLGAALAFYSVFSITPLFVLVIAISGIVFGEDAVKGLLFSHLRTILGREGASSIQELVAGASNPISSVRTAVFSTIVLLIGASSVFGELQSALNIVWKVQPKKDWNFVDLIKERFFSCAVVLSLGFLFLISLVLSTIVTSLQISAKSIFSEYSVVTTTLDIFLSLLITTVIFGFLFKFIPDLKITWKSVWKGALLTSILFHLGKYALGIYLGNTDVATTYGGASSAIVYLIWIYYSSLIFLFGAEFTYVHSQKELVNDEKSAQALNETA